MKFVTAIMMLLTAFCWNLGAASQDGQGEGQPDEDPKAAGKDVTNISSDRDNDGAVDYLLQLDGEGNKLYEELDFNYDGTMDDFYFYSDGILARREIDTNYDGEVDVWVYLHEGVYIERYERDFDFDGTIDQVKDFTESVSE
jgi:hypothetical protein